MLSLQPIFGHKLHLSLNALAMTKGLSYLSSRTFQAEWLALLYLARNSCQWLSLPVHQYNCVGSRLSHLLESFFYQSMFERTISLYLNDSPVGIECSSPGRWLKLIDCYCCSKCDCTHIIKFTDSTRLDLCD